MAQRVGTYPVGGGTFVPFTARESLYRIAPLGLARGCRPYTDRDHTIAELPADLRNLTLLQTRMDHKTVSDSRFAMRIESEAAFTAFVAIDERMLTTWESLPMKPPWIQEFFKDFQPTAYRIRTTDPVMAKGNFGYLVYYRDVQKEGDAPAGVTLGPPCGDPKENSMYFAFVARP